MGKLLIMTSGLTGMLHASLEVASRLQSAGHEVVYASPHDVGAAVERHGIEYAQLPPVPRTPAPERPRQAGESRARHKWAEWRTRTERRDQGLAALKVDATKALVARVQPNLALLDFDLESHVITCHAAGVRVAILSQWFEFRKRPGLPPLGSTLQGGGAAQRWLAWTRSRTQSRARRSATYLRYFGTDRRGVVREHARRSGFPAKALWSHDWSTLFAFDGIPVLSMTMEELDFPHRRRPEWSYVGPMVRLERDDGARGDEPKRQIREAVRRARDGGQRVVYASSSSMDGARDADFAAALVKAAGTQKEWTLILGLGGRRNAAARLTAALGGEPPANATILEFAPQLDALREADLFITHGGIHSIHEALALNVPMVAYSGSSFDQDGCAARLAYHEAASVGARSEGPQAIADRIARALHDERLRTRTHELHRGLARYSSSLVDRVESLMASPASS